MVIEIKVAIQIFTLYIYILYYSIYRIKIVLVIINIRMRICTNFHTQYKKKIVISKILKISVNDLNIGRL